ILRGRAGDVMMWPSNITFDRTAGSRRLAAAAHREPRWRRLQPESGAPDCRGTKTGRGDDATPDDGVQTTANGRRLMPALTDSGTLESVDRQLTSRALGGRGAGETRRAGQRSAPAGERPAPTRDGGGDRFTECNAPSGRRLVRQVARVLEYRKNRAGLVVEEALDDEGERVRQSLFVRRRLAHVIQLAVRRWIAPRHTPAVRRPG